MRRASRCVHQLAAMRHEHEAIVQQLDHAFSEFGFAVVIGHGVPSSSFDRVYYSAKGFFHSNASNKQQYDLSLGYGYGGYLPAGNEAGGQLAGDANPEAKADRDLLERTHASVLRDALCARWPAALV